MTRQRKAVLSALILSIFMGCTLYKNDARKYFESNISEIIASSSIQASCHEWTDESLSAAYNGAEGLCVLTSAVQICEVSRSSVSCDEEDDQLIDRLAEFFELEKMK